MKTFCLVLAAVSMLAAILTAFTKNERLFLPLRIFLSSLAGWSFAEATK